MKNIVTEQITEQKPDHEIMKALAEGKKIKCKVWGVGDSGCTTWVTGVWFNSDGAIRYTTKGHHAYPYAKPVKKKLVVKSVHELVQLFIKEGYIIDSLGNFCPPDGGIDFINEMWKYCEREPGTKWGWHPDWLKEEE